MEQKNNTQFILEDEESQMLGKIISERLETFNAQRRSLLAEIKANISYLVGEQNIQLVGDEVLPLDKERSIESIANVILPAVQKDVSVATRIPPVFDIVPAGTDDDDKATAIACQKIFKYIQRKISRDLERGKAVLWYDIAGISWRKVYWNPHFSVVGINMPPVDDDGNQNPAYMPDIEIGEAITEGELSIENIPANQLIYDYREDPGKLEWIIHAKQVTGQWVLDRFGLEIYNELKSKFSSARPNGENTFTASIHNKFSAAFGGQRLNTPAMSSSADVRLDTDKHIDYYEYWVKPTKSMPMGAFAIMLADQVVAHSPYPIESYPHGELPFIPASPMSISQVLCGAISRISQARPLQREYNRLRSQIAENIDVMGNAVIFAPRAAKLRYRTLDNRAGNIIEYDGPVGRPTRQPGVPMNSQVFVYLAATREAIDNIFAFHDPSRGLAPRNVESGKGLQVLQNADVSHLGPIVMGFEVSDEKVVYQALTVAAANYPNGKLLNIVGNDYEWTLYEIDKNQLRGKFNICVRPNSSMPLDKDAEAARTFQMWESGILGDPSDPELRAWTLEQMHLGNNDLLLQKNSKQKNFAMKEFVVAADNIKKINIPEGATKEQVAEIIEQFLFVPHINPFDDHIIHIKAHSEFLIDNFWQFRSMGDPLYIELSDRLGKHLLEHQLILAEIKRREFEANLQAQMLIKGTTPQQMLLSQIGNIKNKENSNEKKGK